MFWELHHMVRLLTLPDGAESVCSVCFLRQVFIKSYLILIIAVGGLGF